MVISDLVLRSLLVLHVLAGAAWFGAMFYSHAVLQPRLRRHFERPADREAFLLAVSHGARWQVLAAMALVALSGAAVALGRGPTALSAGWLVLIGVKAVLFLASLALFWRISWHWWPERLFALEPELPRVQAKFRRGATAMLLLVGISLVLGVLAHW